MMTDDFTTKRKQLDKQLTYLDLQVKGINKILSQAGNSLTIATFHRLRVHIKKLRALAKLAKSQCRTFVTGEYFHYVKNIFDGAGKVREIQIELDYLKKSRAPKQLSSFRLSLNKTLMLEQNNFTQLRQSYKDAVQKQPSELKKCIKEISREDTEDFLAKNSKKLLKKIRSKKLKNSRAHTLRKELKTLDYIQKSIDQKQGKKPILSDSKGLSDILGKWHDLRVLSKQLKTALNSANLDVSSRTALLDIQSDIKKQAEKKFKKIEKEIKKL